MSVKGQMAGRHLLKIFSLVSAATLWFYVLNSEPLEIERKVGLVLLPPRGLAVNTEVPKTISVKLKGSRAFVKDLFFEGERIFVDLKNFPYQQKAFAVTFDKSMIPVPFGVEVLEVNPTQVMLSLDREIKKWVPVRSKLVGELPKDLKLVKREIEPQEFMIKGPRSVLKKIGQLQTAPVDLSILEGEGVLKIPLEIIDPRVVVEKLNDVHFKYTIRPNKANFTLNDVKIHFLTSRNRFRSRVKTVSLDVLMPEEVIRGLDQKLLRDKLKVIAEIPERSTGKVRVKLRVKLPDGVHLLQMHPKYINVSVR